MNQNFNCEFLILAGGKGLRLKKISGDTPKPLMKINRKPFINYLLDLLEKISVKKVYISICHNVKIFKKTIPNSYKNIKIIFIEEKIPLGTGGSIVALSKIIKKKNLFVMNGDSYVNIDLKKFIDTFKNNNFDALIALNKSIKNENRFGSIKLDKNNQISEFSEKTKTKTKYINAGIYIFKKKIFSSFEQQVNYSLEYDLFKSLIKNYEIFGWPFASDLIDIGTPNSYKEAFDYFKKNEIY